MSEIFIHHAGREIRDRSFTAEDLQTLRDVVHRAWARIPGGPTGERTAEGRARAERLQKLAELLDRATGSQV